MVCAAIRLQRRRLWQSPGQEESVDGAEYSCHRRLGDDHHSVLCVLGRVGRLPEAEVKGVSQKNTVLL